MRVLQVFFIVFFNDKKISLINTLTSVKNKAFIYTTLTNNDFDNISLIQNIIEDYR